jgi:hypothetical protein
MFASIFSSLLLLMIPVFIGGQWLMMVALTVVLAIVSYVITAWMEHIEYPWATRMRISALSLAPVMLIERIVGMTMSYQMGYVVIFATAALYSSVICLLDFQALRQK